MSTEPKFIVRLISVSLSMVINGILLFISIYKIFYKKDKELNCCLLLLLSYLIFSWITSFYNIYYRFIIDPSHCFLSDSIEECLIVFTRSIILFFYVSRLKYSFKKTKYEISNKLVFFMYLFISIYSIIIPIIWIPQQIVTPQITNDLGIYCSNTGTQEIFE